MTYHFKTFRFLTFCFFILTRDINFKFSKNSKGHVRMNPHFGRGRPHSLYYIEDSWSACLRGDWIAIFFGIDSSNNSIRSNFFKNDSESCEAQRGKFLKFEKLKSFTNSMKFEGWKIPIGIDEYCPWPLLTRSPNDGLLMKKTIKNPSICF